MDAEKPVQLLIAEIVEEIDTHIQGTILPAVKILVHPEATELSTEVASEALVGAAKEVTMCVKKCPNQTEELLEPTRQFIGTVKDCVVEAKKGSDERFGLAAALILQAKEVLEVVSRNVEEDVAAEEDLLFEEFPEEEEVMNRRESIAEQASTKKIAEEEIKTDKPATPIRNRRTKPGSLQKAQRMRNAILNEVITTERQYVKDLNTIVQVFSGPIKKLNVLSQAEVHAIFSNISDIHKLNNKCMDLIEKAIEEGNGNIEGVKIGAIFLQVIDGFKIYGTYSKNQQLALDTLASVKQNNREFASFVEQLEKGPNLKGITLNGYLIKPVQRICKYPLLFKEMLKYTSEDMPDFKNIKQCVIGIDEVAEYVNERQRHHDNEEKMRSIRDNMTGTNNSKFKTFELMTPHRMFMRENAFEKVNAHGKKQKRFFFLFNDCIVYSTAPKYTKKGVPSFELKGFVMLDDCYLTSCGGQGEVESPGKASNKHCIEVKRKSNGKRFWMVCDNLSEKKSWMRDMVQLQRQTGDQTEDGTVTRMRGLTRKLSKIM